MKNQQPTRCAWCTSDPLYCAYHDNEWGVPVFDDRVLFEFLTLEGAQAGLNWLTILKKREGYREAFAGFEVEKIACFTPQIIEKQLQNPNIVRHRLKIQAVVHNAKLVCDMKEKGLALHDYFWQFVNGEPIKNQWITASQVPSMTPLSDKISKDLKARGFKFVGSTIMYAYMKSMGMVNDHTTDCFRFEELR